MIICFREFEKREARVNDIRFSDWEAPGGLKRFCFEFYKSCCFFTKKEKQNKTKNSNFVVLMEMVIN